MTLLQHAPTLNLDEAATLAKELYGLSTVQKELPSERDQNFLVANNSGKRFVLKIANSHEQRSLLEAQNAALNHLQARITFTPHLVPARSGESIEQILTESGSHYVRLITYIPGKPLANGGHSLSLLNDFGRKLGKLTQALWDFDDQAFQRNFHWDLANAIRVIETYSQLITPAALRGQIEKYASDFENAMKGHLGKLPLSVIHGDANDYNVVVQANEVVGVIDFGDMIHSYTIGELAIALAYVVLDKLEPLTFANEVVAGYSAEFAVNDDELETLWWLMLMRLCMSVCLAAHQQQQKPENEYLDISQQSIRNALPRLLAIDPRVATDLFSESRIVQH
jgi:Ser/Thr protein kinase RdoA (MazF antagonist)